MVFACLLLLLLYVYLNVPPGFVEKWAGPSRLPDQAVRVSALYRGAFGLPRLPVSPGFFFAAQMALNLAVWITYPFLLRRPPQSRRVFWSFTLLAMLIVMLMPPLLSTDVFYYGITGQIAGTYGGNPHVTPAQNFPQSRLLSYNYWVDFPSPYGPVWTHISVGLVALTDGSAFAVSMTFKAFAALCLLLNAWLIHRLASRFAPDRAWQATALFAWNPLVLLETAGNAHNDALLAASVMATLCLLIQRRTVAGFVLLALSSLVKLTVVPVLALFVAARLAADTWRQRAQQMLLYASLLTLATVLAYLPFWDGTKTLQGLLGQPSGGIQGVVPAIAYHALEMAGGRSGAARAANALSALGIALMALWMACVTARWLRHREHPETAQEALLWGAMLVLVPVLFIRSYPWYTVPGLAVLAAAWPRAQRTTIGLYALCALWFIVRNVL